MGGEAGGGCEGIRQAVPSLAGSLRPAQCEIITRPLKRTPALTSPGAANKFTALSSEEKQPNLWDRASHVCDICMRRSEETLGVNLV